MPDYTKSWSRKQWTRRTEGIFKNIIDALREGRALPKGFIMPTNPVPEGFELIVDPAEYTAPKGIAVTKVFSVCIHSKQNWAGTVTLSQSNNLCSGASVSIDDTTVEVSAETPKNCTYMRLSLPSNCEAGVYKITVTGVSGSITESAAVLVGVGVPPDGTDGEIPKPCTSDADCKKYGDDWWCVDGECLKACGTAQANCNSDYCAQDEKCVWDAASGKCLCKRKGLTLACSGKILVETGSGKTAYGSIVITSLNGFEGTGNIILYDAQQPDQAPSDCITAWMKYGAQSGNILPITLPADGQVAISVVVSSSCVEEGVHYFGVEIEIGGKTAACVIAVEVKSTGFWYISGVVEGDEQLCTINNNCPPFSGGCTQNGAHCNDDCVVCIGAPAKAILKSIGFTGTVQFTASASPKCCQFSIENIPGSCSPAQPTCAGRVCSVEFTPGEVGGVTAHADFLVQGGGNNPPRCQGGSCPEYSLAVTFEGSGGGIAQSVTVLYHLRCRKV